jgi:CcmD family protein
MMRILQALSLLLLLSGVAAAQPKDNEGFEPVNGDMMQKGESIPASRLVGAAYGFVCAAIVVYVVTVARRTRRLEDEVDELKKKIQR